MANSPPVIVNIDNYVLAETAKHFANMHRFARGVNKFSHGRRPVPIDRQSIERMNRDTIYSSAIVNISAGATVIVPDAGGRYMSVVVVDENNYTTAIMHDSGSYPLSIEKHGTAFVAVLVRILVDPTDPSDLEIAHALQQAVNVVAIADGDYVPTCYDDASHQTTHELLKQLGKGMTEASRCNGTRDEVSQVRHMVSAAYGWGGLPTTEVIYINDATPRAVGHYQLNVIDVPVDGFWSISVYNEAGYFEQNVFESYSINNVFAVPNSDGSFTINFGDDPSVGDNFLYVMPGWSYVGRLYQPQESVQKGTWRFPAPTLIK
ncbi:MAG: hypothetical protein ACI8PP_002693 [Candidatus Pseudothioglobus sp.]|jgi:hypothetical protein